MNENSFPKLHNATWPGIVGKGPDSEPPIPFDTMLEMTAAAEVDGIKFDGIDIGLLAPHIDINSSDDEIKRLADKVGTLNLNIGSLVAPIWGGPAMGSKEDRAQFVEMVRKTCHFGKRLRELGVRSYGVVRIDSASSPTDWEKDPLHNTKLIAQTFREACDVAADYGEKLAAEGEICWGGMHSWRTMVQTLEMVDRHNIGFQADMSHTLLYLLGYNRPEDRILPADFEWSDRQALTEGLKTITKELRPRTLIIVASISFQVCCCSKTSLENMHPSQQMWFSAFVVSPLSSLNQYPASFAISSFPLGSVARQCLPVLSWSPVP